MGKCMERELLVRNLLSFQRVRVGVSKDEYGLQTILSRLSIIL